MSILAILFIMSLLVGCSSDSSDEGQGNETEENTGETDEGTGDAEKDTEGSISGELEIQYFVGGYGDAWWKEVIDGFTSKYPDVQIKEQAGPNINEEMKTRWISGNPPDVVYIDGAGSSETQMVEDGQLMDLSDWVESVELPDGTPLADSFIVPPSKFDDGNLYSLPLVFDTWGTWYDKAWFESEGFEAPKDFESWMSSMKEIKNNTDVTPFVTTGQYPYYFSRGVLYPAFAAAGGEELLSSVIKGDEGAWSSDAVLDVMTKVQTMQEEGLIDPGFGALNHTQSQMNFILGKNAYIPVGFWLPNEMANDVPDDFQFGFVPSPMNDAGEPMAIVPDLRPLAIAKEAKNPEAAKAFIEFAFQKKYASKFAELTGAMMNMKGVDLDSNENVPVYLKDANKMINSDQVKIYQKPYPMSADLETPLGNALVSLMLGEMDAEEFTETMEAAAEEYRNNK
ncbi:extracellular solute-binding protein [Aquibacillus sp. 3ASR75-11]|uniref:Extracellular solute-binding protein n=1 Tax=Terrihalobacillus insolitus TaxID=2950438 RepID=A0A9X3WQA8_9BACI|nr:extracellular solute-binding protein [Terrihalobacillus insolitus]MDC3414047.1 extracellular solute-binding protein [Terrihalobacillus insolitus]MDC3424137.1 extracellular solute-binding protein [Terrihalobacillus insolitus]